MKDSLETNLYVFLICFGLILFYVTTYPTILGHPYMKFMLFLCFGVGGLNLGFAIGKIINQNKTKHHE